MWLNHNLVRSTSIYSFPKPWYRTRNSPSQSYIVHISSKSLPVVCKAGSTLMCSALQLLQNKELLRCPLRHQDNDNTDVLSRIQKTGATKNKFHFFQFSKTLILLSRFYCSCLWKMANCLFRHSQWFSMQSWTVSDRIGFFCFVILCLSFTFFNKFPSVGLLEEVVTLLWTIEVQHQQG